jgi:hypothetical protein
MKRRLMKWAAVGLVAATMAGCGGGASDVGYTAGGSVTNISGIASKGPLRGSTLTIYALNPNGTYGAVLGTKSTTSSDGAYAASLSYAGDAIIVVTGGSYTDEATGKTVSLATPLRTVVTGLTGTTAIAVTPMTEAAAEMALADKSSYTLKTKIQNANYVLGAMSGNINIVNTQPVDPTSPPPPGATTDSITYGLLLGTVSQMMKDGKALSVQDAITKITTDLTDGDYKAETTAPVVKTELANFLANARNKTGITSLTQTKLTGALDYVTANAVYPPAVQSDLQMAKNITSEVRNTLLSVYNTQPTSVNGVVQTPFQSLSDELKTKLGHTLYAAVERTAWFIQAACTQAPGTYVLTDPATGDVMNITISSTNTATISVTSGGTGVASGNLTYTKDASGNIVSGTFNGTLNANIGALATSISFTDTVTNGLLASMSFAGSITGQGLSLDMTQTGRGLSITFSPQPGSTTAVYASHITGSAVMTTSTGVLDGSLDIATVWSPKAASINNVCVADAVPSTATFNGSLATVVNGTLTGVKFTGVVTGDWTNAAAFDGCSPVSSTNFVQWDASFNGTITNPSYPLLTAFLSTKEAAYQQATLGVTFKRVNPDGTIVSLSGSGTAGANGSSLGAISISLSDQNNMNLKLGIDNTRACTDPAYFTASIVTSGGAVMGNGYTLSCAPMIKYMDGYFESVL